MTKIFADSPAFSSWPFLLAVMPAFVSLGAEAACTALSRTCTETNADGRCVRYTNTFKCVTEHPDKDRCTANTRTLPEAAVTTRSTGPLDGCRASGTVCSRRDADGLCLETETSLTCDRKPEGAGVTVGAPEITFEWSVIRTPNINPQDLGAGCRVTSAVCTDSKPREVPIANSPGETATAAPDCWVKALTVSCPVSDAASSCQRLEEAGCQKTGDVVCEQVENGICVRWAATYRCQGEQVSGPDIQTDDTIVVPGEIIDDRSDCDRTVADAATAGLTCETVANECVKPGTTPGLACEETRVTLRCTGRGGDGCRALKALAEEGSCRQEGETHCKERDPSGACIRESAFFLCGEAATPTVAAPATLIEEKSVPNWTDDPVCRQPVEQVRRGFPEPYLTRAVPGAPVELTGCVKTSAVCSEGPGVRFVDGRPEWRACWAMTETWTCSSQLENECKDLEARRECELVSETCTDEEDKTDAGGCRRPTRVYRCTVPGSSGVIGEICDGQTCIAGVCRPTDGKIDGQFINGLVQLEIGRQAAGYGNPMANRFFQGAIASCKDRKGASSCCRAESASDTSNSAFSVLIGYGVNTGLDYIRYLGSPYVYDMLAWSETTGPLLSALYGDAGPAGFEPTFSYWGATASWSAASGWEFSFSPGTFLATAALHFYGRYTSCNAEDVKTSMAKGQRLCHFVGTKCEKRVSGLGCVETSEKYVCFNSRLARIIHEQGRRQLNRGWGSPNNPDARGFTLEELERLDFSDMDLSEFTSDVIQELSKSGGISEEKAAARAAERVAAMIKKELSPTAPVRGSTGKIAGTQPNHRP